MRFWLMVAFMIVTISPLFIMRLVSLNDIRSQLEARRMTEVSNYALMLSNQIARSDFYEDPENLKEYVTDMNQSASVYSGRILVIDNNYKILQDTYGTLEGLTSISEETIDAMQGEIVRTVDHETTMVEVSVPVRNEDSDDVIGVVQMYASTSDITSTLTSISKNYNHIMLILAVICILASLAIARLFTRPLINVAGAMDRIGEGHFDEEVHMEGFSEIEMISDSFNLMLNRMRQLEESRQEFVSNVSHELKTPITSVKVLADSLNMQEDVPVELYKEFMQDIVSEIDRETRIINDLLTLVKMDKTVDDLNVSTVNINQMLEMLIKRLKPIAGKKNVELVFESFRQVNAEVDEVKLNLALMNLVENGIKYNISGGYVKTSLDADKEFFYVKVKDSGIGIPEAYQDQIFDRFYRVDKARSRETGGTGLGLAITKQIILLHEGVIRVMSKEDEGSTFVVRIPLKFEKRKVTTERNTQEVSQDA